MPFNSETEVFATAAALAAGAALRCSPATGQWTFSGLPDREILLRKVLARGGMSVAREDGVPDAHQKGRCHMMAMAVSLACCHDLMVATETPRQLQKAVRILDSREKVRRLLALK